MRIQFWSSLQMVKYVYWQEELQVCLTFVIIIISYFCYLLTVLCVYAFFIFSSTLTILILSYTEKDVLQDIRIFLSIFIIMASKSCLVAFLHCCWLSDCSVLYFGRHDRLDLLFIRTYRFPHSLIFWRKYHVFFIIRRMIIHSYTHFKELEMKNKEEEMKKKKKKEEEPPSPSNSVHSIIVL